MSRKSRVWLGFAFGAIAFLTAEASAFKPRISNFEFRASSFEFRAFGTLGTVRSFEKLATIDRAKMQARTPISKRLNQTSGANSNQLACNLLPRPDLPKSRSPEVPKSRRPEEPNTASGRVGLRCVAIASFGTRLGSARLGSSQSWRPLQW